MGNTLDRPERGGGVLRVSDTAQGRGLTSGQAIPHLTAHPCGLGDSPHQVSRPRGGERRSALLQPLSCSLHLSSSPLSPGRRRGKLCNLHIGSCHDLAPPDGSCLPGPQCPLGQLWVLWLGATQGGSCNSKKRRPGFLVRSMETGQGEHRGREGPPCTSETRPDGRRATANQIKSALPRSLTV